MSTIKFYKDSNGAFRLTDCTGKLSYINKGDIVSAYAENGVCSMMFSDEVYNRFTHIHNKNTAITDFVNASSVAYNEAGLNAVLSDFFVKSAGGISSGVEVINALGYTPASKVNGKVPAEELPSALTVGAIEQNFGGSETLAISQKSITEAFKMYFEAKIPGYITKSGAFNDNQEARHYVTDYVKVGAGDMIFIADGTACGEAANLCSFYNDNKTFVKELSNNAIITTSGYVRFCWGNSSGNAKSFGLTGSFVTISAFIQAQIDANKNSITGFSDMFRLSKLFKTEYSCNENVTSWQTNSGATMTFDNADKCAVLSSGSTNMFAGVKVTEANTTTSVPRIVIFEAKGVSGDYSNIGISYMSYPLPDTCKVSLTNAWKTYVVELPTNETNQFLSILTYNPAAFSIKIKNLYFSDFPNYGYFAIKQYQQLYLLKNTIDIFKGNKDSIERRLLDNSIADFDIPSWVGKSELKIVDLFPSINNQGQSYLYDNAGTIELRVVKDATTIVGCALTTKKQNAVSAKSFKICHFGDSITVGVGSTTGYVPRLKTLLEADGHTVTTQTNAGISGATAESLYATYKNTTPVHHDFATLMIGINDQDRWLRNYNANYAVVGIKAEDFRMWFRMQLRLLIGAINTYATPSKLFLIVPYKSVCEMRSGSPYPSDYAYYSQPLQDVIVQEVIAASKDLANIFICRADYYVPNSYDYIPDGLHATDNGAQLLAKGLRDEITFRV